jgi:preprotein translocase subunit SecD
MQEYYIGIKKVGNMIKLGARIWILIFMITVSILAISPKFSVEGVEVKSVGGVAELYGLKIGDNILSFNEIKVNNVEEFNDLISAYAKKLKEINLVTSGGVVSYEAKNILFEVDENLTVINSQLEDLENGVVLRQINNNQISNLEDFNENVKELFPQESIKIETKDSLIAFITSDELEISVKEPRKNNIKKGLELEGGTRVLLKPVGEDVNEQDVNDLMDVLRNRLNVYGLTDMKMRIANSGEDYLILIEMAGIGREEIEGFVSQQGKFEAKIGNETIFRGGKEDVPFVCRDDGTCSGVHSCNAQSSSGNVCRFQFEIRLSSDAAKKHAEVTKKLDVIFSEGGQSILSEQIEFYLDDELIDSLNIDSSLKGSEGTSIQITGPGFGINEQEALDNAVESMERLQTVLITGSLPFELEIVKLDSISPVFGSNLIKNIFLVGFASLISVLAVIYIRYRNFKILLPLAITLVSEILIILGLAAIIGWNLDLAAIAGIIAAVGTGVDDQIVITDEIMKGEKERFLSWKERIKRAFYIILVAYFSTLVAMLPLWGAAAGLLRGFAITTILGVSIGVLITRPAFASMLEKLLNKEE